MIVDTNGQIVFSGHPAHRKNLEADFDTLLKGDKIVVEPKEKKEVAKDISSADASSAMEKFSSDT